MAKTTVWLFSRAGKRLSTAGQSYLCSTVAPTCRWVGGGIPKAATPCGSVGMLVEFGTFPKTLGSITDGTQESGHRKCRNHTYPLNYSFLERSLAKPASVFLFVS